MPTASDFYITIDRAARLIDDAGSACRASVHDRLPAPQRRSVRAAIVGLEKAQLALFAARNEPWSPPPPQPKRAAQLELI